MEVLKTDELCGVRAPGYNYIFRKSDGRAIRWGSTMQEDPFWAPVPELADISISNRCSNGCSFCYRDSRPDGSLMTKEDFGFVLSQIPATFQVALGGGEPTEHPDFIEFLKMSHEAGKVPNYTTNGTRLTREIVEATKRYCGASAVSWSPTAFDAVDEFVRAGVKTNIHFVVSVSTIGEAIRLLQSPEELRHHGVNAIVFLLHKAVGRGKPKDTPTVEQMRPLMVEAFSGEAPVAFDVCSVPHIAAAEKRGEVKVDWHLLDYCDGARFTVYVDEALNVSPCSFVKTSRFTENLRDRPMSKIWVGPKFEEFRRLLRQEPLVCHALSHAKEQDGARVTE
ncbi:MAG: radical SAM protein [Candidatus Thorarchaeota archaeon]|nr:radical SAM protein [Candidatus Thorarchaeota archaeon]